MEEITYQDINGNEFYLDREAYNDRNVLAIYTYNDTNSPDVDTSKWKSDKNPVFIHCPKELLNETFLRLEVTCISESDLDYNN